MTKQEIRAEMIKIVVSGRDQAEVENIRKLFIEKMREENVPYTVSSLEAMIIAITMTLTLSQMAGQDMASTLAALIMYFSEQLQEERQKHVPETLK